MVGITTISTHSMACTIYRFKSHGTPLGTSQMTLEWICDTSKKYPRIVGARVFNVSQFQWTWLHGTLREHAMMNWHCAEKLGVIGPITKRFCRQLEQKWAFVYSLSFGFATYFLTINVIWKFSHMCTSLCSIISNFQILTKNLWIVCGCLLKTSLFKVYSVTFVTWCCVIFIELTQSLLAQKTYLQREVIASSNPK